MKKPRYNLNDIVAFEYYGRRLSGKISVVDAFGTFEQHEEPSYDILVEGGSTWTLYKHVREFWIVDEAEGE